MVAPSFEKDKILGEPFYENGKYYVNIEHHNTKNVRKVRWYTDSEYAKQYGKKIKQEPVGNYKVARGFSNGPIAVIRKNKVADEEWLRQSVARYAVGVGWYIASTDEIPSDRPPHIKFLLLGWNEVSPDGVNIKSPSEVSDIITEKMKKKEWINFD